MIERITHGVTVDTIIIGVIMGSITHSFLAILRWLLKGFEAEAGKIIESHVKSGHKSRFKHCKEGDCAIPGTASDFLAHQ